VEAIKSRCCKERHYHGEVPRRYYKMITPADQINDIEVLPTDIFLDEITGGGGMPRGRICEFWGAKDTGKSSAALQVVAAAQRAGLKCLYIDVEFSLSTEYAAKLGVDISKMDVLRESSAEEFLDATEVALRSNKYQVLVLDSIGDLSSKAEQEKAAGERTIGMQASLMSKFSRMVAPLVSLNKILFIGVNHERIDFMGMGKVYQMGGKKWSEKVKLSIRFREKSGVVLKNGDTQVGRVIIAKVDKNHVWGTKGKEMEVNLLNSFGFSQAANLLDVAISSGAVSKVGSTYFIGETKLGTIGKARSWALEPGNDDLLKVAIEKYGQAL